MANYNYDEGGSMAAYFLITILVMVLIPLTLSSMKRSIRKATVGCQCQPCIDQRARIAKREKGPLFAPKLSKRTYFLIAGWSLLAYLSYKVAGAKVENKVYNPFEILEISTSATEKEIKSHYKKLSRLYHPDKVTPTVNETIEVIQDRFVRITKAYKALTDETIRKNWELYGNPDGRQEMSMGIALPKWIVESHNNIWVLGFYGLLFGGALPALVGRWWFGNRQRTKDGVHALSAAAFFKLLREESTVEEVVGALGKAYQFEMPDASAKKSDVQIDKLESEIEKRAGAKWTEVRKIAKDSDGKLHVKRRRALVLIYAHLLRIGISDSKLRKEQTEVLLQLPLLLNALLNVSIARNWLLPTLAAMRLHAYFAQALPPLESERLRFLQLPNVQNRDIDTLSSSNKNLIDVVEVLQSKNDARTDDVRKALEKWGRIEIVDAAFKVIGENVVAPSSIVFLVVKLRINPLGKPAQQRETGVEEAKRSAKYNQQMDEKFLTTRGDTEEYESDNVASGAAHAPYWPGERKPSWWVVLADDKLNRVVVPPFKVTDVPYANPDADRDYRSYKIQFQAPQNVGLFTWKIYLVSDTFVGEDVTRDIILRIEEPPVQEHQSDDDISDPEEDSLAGQMAMMRGAKVKKKTEEDEDESSTDDDVDEDSSSDSDSD